MSTSFARQVQDEIRAKHTKNAAKELSAGISAFVLYRAPFALPRSLRSAGSGAVAGSIGPVVYIMQSNFPCDDAPSISKPLLRRICGNCCTHRPSTAADCAAQFLSLGI